MTRLQKRNKSRKINFWKSKGFFYWFGEFRKYPQRNCFYRNGYWFTFWLSKFKPADMVYSSDPPVSIVTITPTPIVHSDFTFDEREILLPRYNEDK